MYAYWSARIERQRSRVAGALLEQPLLHEHEAHAGRALDALARRRDQRVERRVARVDGKRPERAHRIDDQVPSHPCHDVRDLLQRIEDAGRRLAVDEAHVRDRRVLREEPLHVLRRRQHIVGDLERGRLASHHGRQLRHPLAVGAVDQHQDVAVTRHERIEGSLDRERAAALHWDADVRVRTVDHGEQLCAHAGSDGIELRVPRAPVAQHRGLRGERRRERAGCEEDGIAVLEAHGGYLNGSVSDLRATPRPCCAIAACG
jgi:hypothetical protein